MRVYMAPCGIGLGHITRLHPIAEELNKRGISTVFSTYLDGLQYAKHNKLPAFEAVPLNFRVTPDGTIDFKMTAATAGFSLGIRTFLRQVTREIQFLKQFRPDVVVSDSRASSLVAAWLLRIPAALVLNQFRVEIVRRPTGRRLSLHDRLFFFIANIGWLFIRTVIQLVWGTSQVILIPDLPAPYTISLGNLAVPSRYSGKVKLIGPTIENDGNSAAEESRTREELGFARNRPLIYGAVSGPRIEREVLGRMLLESFEQLPRGFQVVLSRGDPNGSRRAHREGGVKVFDWLENQDDFIRASDVVVSRAGHGTIMKSLLYGKPMVLIPIPDHTEQIGNARRALQLHVARIIDQKVLNGENLQLSIEEILDSNEYRTKTAEISRIAGSMQSIPRACDIIEKLGSRN
jgi:UDP:flavonoid glycosyltransferase YjiC (YdhE family)